MDLSIIIPAYNEEQNLPGLIATIREVMSDRAGTYEIIVVDDASTDDTAEFAEKAGAKVVSHSYNIGNGAAVKTGIRQATGEKIVLMDGDGQHRPEVIPQLLKELDDYDLVVAARSTGSHAGTHRLAANTIYNWMASYVTKFKILDLTSGFRATRRKTAQRYLYLLPNTFSYPTTMTMSYLRSGLRLKYVPIDAPPRGKGSRSKIRLFADGTRFFLIITKIATLYSPFRVFLPLSAALFFTGAGYYLYTFLTAHRFSNMSMLLFSSSLIIFMLGLVSEQISQLRMDRTEREFQ
ncbi:MAG: glycosyltransferase family 2 protein [Deltaproteobacteria bacterium]|nr:glycosyltransferase family 2 protein [Deltaproteobacteria bacterium]